MSGEGLGTVAGLAFLLAAGGAMAAAIVAGGLLAAAAYVGYQAVNEAGKLALSGIDKRRQNMLNQISKELETLKFDSSFSAENMSCEMEKLYQSREDAVKELKATFDADKEEGALERFLEEMYMKNTLFIEEISKQKDMLINEYEEKMNIDIENLTKAINENRNKIDTKLNQFQSEFQKHEEESYKEAWRVYTIANCFFEQLREEYTELEDVCPAEIKGIEKSLSVSKEQLDSNGEHSYQSVISSCIELPSKIVECMNKCDKYKIGKFVYIDASGKMLSEIRDFLEKKLVEEYKNNIGDIEDGAEEKFVCEIKQFMKGKYEEILKTVDQYHLRLKEKSYISEMELVDIYHEICELYADTIDEVINGMGRIKSYHMRNDIAQEVVEGLVEQGYSIKERKTDKEAGKVVLDLLNNENGNVVSVVISEQDHINYVGQKELVNNIEINHVSNLSLTDETEEERFELRQKVMDSINTSEKLEKEYGSLRCNIECKTDSYMKNPVHSKKWICT